MTDLRFEFDWISYPDDNRIIGETTAHLKIYLGSTCVTRNEDIWSKSTRDHITVSLYPLAMWVASSWWRLNYEVLPGGNATIPKNDWRMSHEMAAANHGYVWPKVMFATDREVIHAWAESSDTDRQDAVRYLNDLRYPCAISRKKFAQTMSDLIETVIARIADTGAGHCDLAKLWQFIRDDQRDPAELRHRRLEAELGFDPEECPDNTLASAILLEDKLGIEALAELAGAYAEAVDDRVDAIKDLIAANGLMGEPKISPLSPPAIAAEPEPWRRGVSMARKLRDQIGRPGDVLSDGEISGLLGLSSMQVENWSPIGRQRASVAGWTDEKMMKFVPRKRHPIARRFEMARFIGDYTGSDTKNSNRWLVTTDLSTARQKYQRAFAAEFLCPIDSLTNFLNGDFSTSAFEDAANEFQVSEDTIKSLLKNNGFLPRNTRERGLPYDSA